MPRDPGKSKQKRADTRKTNQPKATSWLYQCPSWPLYEVLLSEDWDKEGALPTMLVARQSPRSGKIATAAFLVDLGCLGIKSTFVRICKSPDDYTRRVRDAISNDQTLLPADVNLVAKIIAEGLAYGQRLGFTPDPEYNQASLLLAGAEPAACDVEVPLGGPEGKPLYIPGPYDNIERIATTLVRAVGEDGFEVREPT